MVGGEVKSSVNRPELCVFIYEQPKKAGSYPECVNWRFPAHMPGRLERICRDELLMWHRCGYISLLPRMRYLL